MAISKILGDMYIDLDVLRHLLDVVACFDCLSRSAMPITSFHILDASSIVQLASLHFVPCDVDTQAEREELFAEGTQELWGGDEAQVLFSHAGWV